MMRIITVNDFYNQTGAFQNISTELANDTLANAEIKLNAWKKLNHEEKGMQLIRIMNELLTKKDQLSAFITIEIAGILTHD